MDEEACNDDGNAVVAVFCDQFLSFCNVFDAVSSSKDGRISVIHEQGINVYQAKSHVSDCTSAFGYSFTFVENPILSVPYDVGVDTVSFPQEPTEFPGVCTFLLDNCLNPKASAFHNCSGYKKCVFSPLGCTPDGGSLLAAITFDGKLTVYRSKEIAGTWIVYANLSMYSYNKMCEKKFEMEKVEVQGFDDTERNKKLSQWKALKLPNDIKITKQEMFETYRSRKYHLCTTAVCWCPRVKHKSIDHRKGMCETADRKVFADTAFIFLASGVKDGCLIIWLLEVNLASSDCQISIAKTYDTGSIGWISSLGWHQDLGKHEGYVVAAFTDGKINLFVFHNPTNSNNIQMLHNVEIWCENDEIIINHIEWVKKGETLYVVAAKGTRLIVFHIVPGIDSTSPPTSTYKIGPIIHHNTICGMDITQDHKILTSSFDGAIACTDLETLEVQMLSSNVKDGYMCQGFAIIPDTMMLCTAITPNNILMKQVKFQRKCEVLFTSILPLEKAAEYFASPNCKLGAEIQEYFRSQVSSGIDLPPILRAYCHESLDKLPSLTIIELQKISFLTWLFMMHAESLKEIDTDTVVGLNVETWGEKCSRVMQVLFESIVTHRLKLWRQFLNENLDKPTAIGKEVALLNADCIIMYGRSEESVEMGKLCYAGICGEKGLICQSQPEKTDDVISPRPFCFKLGPGSSLHTSKSGSAYPVASHSNKDDNIVNVDSTIKNQQSAIKRLLRPAREKCPLCGSEIHLTDINTDRCRQGHTWSRCCLTLSIVSQFKCRQCQGCSRYALSKETLHDENPSFRKELLAVENCPFCNGRLISLLH